MRPKDVVLAWVDAFNREHVDALAALYHADAINHQVTESPCPWWQEYSGLCSRPGLSRPR